MKAYEILTEYFWGLQSEVALWEFDIPSCSTKHRSVKPTMPINISSSSLSLLALLLWANPFQCFCTLIAATSGSIEGAPTDNIKSYLPWTGDSDWHEMWDWYVSEIRWSAECSDVKASNWSFQNRIKNCGRGDGCQIDLRMPIKAATKNVELSAHSAMIVWRQDTGLK